MKNQKTLSELEILVVGWASERSLIKLDNAPKQRLKLAEEVGEIASAILKNNVDGIKDGIGDVFVVLVILGAQIDYKLRLESFLRWADDIYSSNPDELIAEITQYAKLGSLGSAMRTLHYLSELLGYDLTECANLAWNEIKDRRGVTLNGTFLKS